MLSDFFYRLVFPSSTDEDLRRQEYILNVILLISMVLSASAFLRILLDNKIYGREKIIYLSAGSALFFIFTALYKISRRGFFKVSSYILIMAYAVPSTYGILKFGANLSTGLLCYSLVIIMSSILISAAFSIKLFLAFALAILIFGYLQIRHAVSVWDMRPLAVVDFIIYAGILGAVLAVSWLYDFETKRLLARARKSEEDLKKERDLLEMKVKKRTDEIKKMQAEKIQQLARCAEVGRLASGIFHDLMNPLSVVSLNLSEINEKNKEIMNAKLYLQQAILATRKMEDFLQAISKIIRNEGTERYFSANKEILQAIQLFSHKARTSWVEIIFKKGEDIKIYGDPIKFNQLISNLISNGIDSYENIDEHRYKRKVKISIYGQNNNVHLNVKDWGCGISDDLREKIFEPFFTTKENGKGTGIGLFSTKNIIEKSFFGHIKAIGKEGVGTAFYITFPKREEECPIQGRPLRNG